MKKQEIKRKMDQDISLKFKKQQKELELVEQGKHYNKMMVLLTHHSAKLSVNQLQKNKKEHVSKLIEQERVHQDQQNRRTEEQFQKKLEFVQKIEGRIESTEVMTKQYRQLYQCMVQSNTHNSQEQIEVEKKSPNVSFADQISRKISKALDRPSTGSMITTRRSDRMSQRIRPKFANRTNLVAADRIEENFRTFQYLPVQKKQMTPLDPYSRKRAITQQYRQMKMKYDVDRRQVSNQDKRPQQNFENKRIYHRTSSSSRGYQTNPLIQKKQINIGKLQHMLVDIEKKQQERRERKKIELQEQKMKLYHSFNSGKTPASRRPLLKSNIGKTLKVVRVGKDTDTDKSFVNTDGYASFGNQGFFITEAQNQNRGKKI